VPGAHWRLPASSRVPVIAFAGGADPQDPVTNLSNLKQHFAELAPRALRHVVRYKRSQSSC
jgi:hypothetical protein